MTSLEKSVFLGGPEDPQPVWRSEASDADTWPEGAVFRVVFTDDLFGERVSREIRRRLPLVAFFGADGWPVGLPAERKSRLTEDVRRDLQVFPREWETWSESTWRCAERSPATWTRARALGKFVPPLVELTADLA